MTPLDNQTQPEFGKLDGQLLADLWIFRWTARLGSVTAAANRLHVTQGAVSQRIMRLEARLGIMLFSRKARRLELTEAGEQILLTMNAVSSMLNSALSRYDRSHPRTLVVSCMPSLATEWLVPRLGEFYELHPDIELFIRAEMLPASVERVEDEGVDLFIRYEEDTPADMQELASLQELIFPVCSAGYRAQHLADNGELEKIVRLHDVMPWLGGPQYFEWERWSAQTLWKTHNAIDRHFNLANLAYHAALNGQGIAMGRSVLVNRLIARGELVPASPLAPVKGATYRVVAHRPGNARSPIRRFSNWLIGEMRTTQENTLALLAGDPPNLHS